MRTEQITNKTEVIEYNSLHEFYKYLIHTPFNDAFCWAKHSSVDGDYYFTKTRDFSEAVELFKNGWSDMATKLVQKLKVIESKGIRATFSYRCMIMITKLEAKGMNLEVAMKISIVKGLDKDTINTFNLFGNTKYHSALRKIQLAA